MFNVTRSSIVVVLVVVLTVTELTVVSSQYCQFIRLTLCCLCKPPVVNFSVSKLLVSIT